MVELINQQRDLGSNGRIAIKVNGLTDPTIIDALYEASIAGVEVRLIIRTLCCLRPGVPDLSENISVHSVVGEFLEHSRMFSFGQRDSDNYSVFMGSADLMERNLDRRVEVIVPLLDAAIRDEVEEFFDVTWRDDTHTWVLGTDRRWRKLQSVNNFSAQEEFKHRELLKSRTVSN